MLDWPPEQFCVSFPRRHSHYYTLCPSIGAVNDVLYSPQSPEPSGVSFVVHRDDFSLRDVVVDPSLSSCAIKLSQFQQILLLPAIPEPCESLEKVFHPVCESLWSVIRIIRDRSVR